MEGVNIMKYPVPVVGAVIINPDNKILLCKSHKWNDEYVIPGGHIELGEKWKALERNIRGRWTLDALIWLSAYGRL